MILFQKNYVQYIGPLLLDADCVILQMQEILSTVNIWEDPNVQLLINQDLLLKRGALVSCIRFARVYFRQRMVMISVLLFSTLRLLCLIPGVEICLSFLEGVDKSLWLEDTCMNSLRLSLYGPVGLSLLFQRSVEIIQKVRLHRQQQHPAFVNFGAGALLPEHFVEQHESPPVVPLQPQPMHFANNPQGNQLGQPRQARSWLHVTNDFVNPALQAVDSGVLQGAPLQIAGPEKDLEHNDEQRVEDADLGWQETNVERASSSKGGGRGVQRHGKRGNGKRSKPHKRDGGKGKGNGEAAGAR